MSHIIKARRQNKLSKGIKIKAPEENEELTMEDIEIIKRSSQMDSASQTRSVYQAFNEAEEKAFEDF